MDFEKGGEGRGEERRGGEGGEGGEERGILT